MADSLSHPKSFPQNPMNLSIIQEALIDLPGTDIFSIAIKLGAKTDIRQTILELRDAFESNPSFISNLISEYILALINEA